jgi:hypothetical protein
MIRQGRFALIFLRFFTQVVEIGKLPAEEQGLLIQKTADALKGDWLPPARFTQVYLLPRLQKLARDSFADTAELRCAAVALAVERYRCLHGSWPNALDVLVPDGLARVPVDPSDGKPLHYVRLPDGVLVHGAVDPIKGYTPGKDSGFRLWDVSRRRQPPPPMAAPDATPPP